MSELRALLLVGLLTVPLAACLRPGPSEPSAGGAKADASDDDWVESPSNRDDSLPTEDSPAPDASSDGAVLAPSEDAGAFDAQPLEPSPDGASTSTPEASTRAVRCRAVGCVGHPVGIGADGKPLPQPAAYARCTYRDCSDGATYEVSGSAESRARATCECARNGSKYKAGECHAYFTPPDKLDVEAYCGVSLGIW